MADFNWSGENKWWMYIVVMDCDVQLENELKIDIDTHIEREREKERVRERWPGINEMMLVVLQHFSDVSVLS